MQRIFEGSLRVHYGQAYVLPSDMYGLDLNDSFAKQENGLCGAATTGALFLITGQHTGDVGFALDIAEAAPSIDDKWEEIVEVPLKIFRTEIHLQIWGGEKICKLPLAPGWYRARYCAFDMQLGQESDGDDGIVDQYYLVIWPEDPPKKDKAIKVTSEIARYWHDNAQSI